MVVKFNAPVYPVRRWRLSGLLASCLGVAALTAVMLGCSSRPAPEIRVTRAADGTAESILLLGRHVLDDDVRQQISEHPQIRELALQECSQVTDAGLAGIAAAKQLAKLSLIRVGITDAGLAPLAELPSLADLELAHTKVQGEGLQHASGLPLRRLVLVSHEATYDGLVSLAELKSLNELELDCKHLRLAELAGLAHLKQLKKLNAMAMESGASLEPLRGLPLTHLHLTCAELGDQGAEVLNSLTQLEEAQLTRSQVTDAGLQHLTLPALKNLSLSGSIGVTDAGLANLSGMPLLETLFLGETGVTGKDMAPLAVLKNLKAVLLNGMQFKGDEKSIEALRQLLPDCEVIILRG